MPSPSASSETILFGEFEANLRSRELYRQGLKVKLPDQSFRVLAMLLEQAGELVTREEIHKRLWPGDTFVDFDHGLHNAVNRLRDALGDSADSPRFIETLPRRGYRFIALADGTIPGRRDPNPKAHSGESPFDTLCADGTAARRPQAATSKRHPWLLWGLPLAILALILLVAFLSQKPPLRPSSRLFLLPPEGATFNLIGDEGGSVALSPDGTRLAFVAVDAKARRRIWVRVLSKLTSDAIDGTDGATFPFWSPDGSSIGFFSDGKLKKIGADGRSAAIPLCDAPFGRGGSWNSHGTIIFAPDSHSGIYRVSASGGTPTPITTVDKSLHTSHRWPRFLPDGNHFIYLAVSHFNPANHNGVYFSSLDGRPAKLVIPTDGDATYSSGYFFFLRKDLFMAQRFDPERGELLGQPRPTPEKVLYDPVIWKTVFDATEHGVMAYQLGDRVRGSQFRWFDRAGKQLGVLGEPSFQWEPSISPDGRQLVVGIANGGYSNLWVYDLVHAGRMQITFSKYDNGSPVWSPDSARVLFAAKRQHYSLYEVDSRGAEREHLILDTGIDSWPLDLSPDGRFLLFAQGVDIGKSRSQIWVYPLRGKHSPFRLLAGEALERDAQFSPDGRWVAYTSNESGRDEVYVVPFIASSTSSQAQSAALDRKWRISTAGGHAPRWRRSGRELFYLASDNTIVAVPVLIAASRFSTGVSRPLFRANPGFYNLSYDVSPDGARFIVNTAPEQRAAPITVVENWLSDFAK